VKNLLSSSLLSKDIKIKIYRTIILPVLYGCETWSLILKMFDNRVLRKVPGPKRDEVQECREDCIMSFVMCTHKYYAGSHVKTNEMGG
jgi:hypothetical protein